MTNGGRFPLLIGGQRIVLMVTVERRGDEHTLWAAAGNTTFAMNTVVPLEGLRLTCLIAERPVTIVVGPARAHLISLELGA